MADIAVDVEQFCLRAFPRLVRTLTVVTGDPLLADEVVQEALARAWQRWDRVGSLESPEAWCYRVAANLATSSFRRRAAERRALARLPHEPRLVGETEISDEPLRTAMATLPEQQRWVLALRYLADCSIEQTASILRIAPGTVKSTTSRGLEALRLELQGDQP